jgi:hypothetical protein
MALQSMSQSHDDAAKQMLQTHSYTIFVKGNVNKNVQTSSNTISNTLEASQLFIAPIQIF